MDGPTSLRHSSPTDMVYRAAFMQEMMVMREILQKRGAWRVAVRVHSMTGLDNTVKRRSKMILCTSKHPEQGVYANL